VPPILPILQKVVLRLSEHGDVIETQTLRFVPPKFFSKLDQTHGPYHRVCKKVQKLLLS